MRNILIILSIGVLACFAGAPAASQATGKPAAAPGGFVPTNASAYRGADGNAVYDSAATPHPIDPVVKTSSIDRGLIVGFSGTSGAATSSSTTLTTAAIASASTYGGVTYGVPVVGQIILGTGVSAGTTITAVSGASPTFTLTLSAAATVASGAAISSAGPQQVMPTNLLRRGVAYQNQSSTADCYINGVGAVTTDFHSLKLAASATGTYFDGSPTHIGTGAQSVLCTAAATPLYAREIN